jgi:hypothetical protein
MKKIAAFILFIGVLDSISAQSTLTLDSCRALALSNNKELRISAEKKYLFLILVLSSN